MITKGNHSPSNINPPVNLLQPSLKKYQMAKYPYITPKRSAGRKRTKIPIN
jgi:hypothetical protein